MGLTVPPGRLLAGVPHRPYASAGRDGIRKKIAYNTGTTISVSTEAKLRPNTIVTAIETKNASRSSGSIPITGVFLDELGAYTVSFGFALRDEGAHAPDEFFRLSSFVRGQAAYCQLLHSFAEARSEEME